LAAIIFCVGILMFWHFRQTEWHPARRAFSAVKAVDFSWRNRIAAWEGDLQITAEHPWFGTGWNQPEPLYEHYYQPPKLTESAAIQMNDYLMLGATLGIPALFCFGMYIWLCLGDGSWKMGDRKQQAEGQSRKSEIGSHDLKSEPRSPISDLLSTTCRAGAIVLLVGFWFDGGLFKLPTAATFWILLELGSVGNREIHESRKETGMPVNEPQKDELH
jgi:O-antigen ligase